jgi:hypothetical protein
MLTTYTAVLCSPGFIFIDERPGRLDDYALATRLSYFLWNSEPDEALRALAARGELHRPEVLRAETERLLNDPKSRRFVEAFTDYWLDLRKFDDTSPSATLYNDYELDDPLKLAALEETRLFFAEMLRDDLPVRNIVDSDFAFLNERLADHYGLPGVKGAKVRKVTLPKDTVRGGLMTQASVLKVTANVARSRFASNWKSIATMRVAPRATVKWTRPASRWKASMSWAAGATVIAR